MKLNMSSVSKLLCFLVLRFIAPDLEFAPAPSPAPAPTPAPAPALELNKLQLLWIT